MKIWAAIGATAIMAMGSATAAQGVDCDSASNQASMTACATAAFETAEAELTMAYAGVSDRLDATGANRFQTAQAAFTAYRDAWCAFTASGVEGGSLQPMVVADCKTDLTLAHLAAVQLQSICQEGDVSCVNP